MSSNPPPTHNPLNRLLELLVSNVEGLSEAIRKEADALLGEILGGPKAVSSGTTTGTVVTYPAQPSEIPAAVAAQAEAARVEAARVEAARVEAARVEAARAEAAEIALQTPPAPAV